ncbi:MAG TPA: substrate-binding domain-containing protein [Thermoleophilaceae bacterium]
MKLRLGLGAGLALALALPAAASATTLIGSGSVAAQPVLQALFNGYHKANPSFDFVYTANGGNAGVKDVQAGRSQFAGQARPPLPSDAGTTYIKAYLDGLCLLVNPQNSLHSLTLSQLGDIYSARLTDWKTFPGAKLTGTINPYGRDANGGTYNFFSQAVLQGNPPAGNVNALGSDGLIANAVKQDKYGIGYDGLAYTKLLRPIKVNGIACDHANVKSERYPLSRYIYIVIPSESPDPNVTKFIDWARRSRTAGGIINNSGGVAVFNKTAPKKKKRRHT